MHSTTEYSRTLPGTNISVRFHEKSAAVIGVTGRKQDVDKYGGILKKMTEILMLNIYYKQHFDLEERLRNHFLREWLYGEPQIINYRLRERDLSLGIDITVP